MAEGRASSAPGDPQEAARPFLHPWDFGGSGFCCGFEASLSGGLEGCGFGSGYEVFRMDCYQLRGRAWLLDI